MPTIDDLRDAFDHLAAAAPTTVTPTRPQHRARTATLAAAGVVALAVGVPFALHAAQPRHQNPPAGSQQPTQPSAAPIVTYFDQPLPAPGAGESPALRFGFQTGTIAYPGLPDQITGAYQHATITAGSDAVGQVFVFYQGSYDATAARQGEPVTLGGTTTGYYARLVPPGDSEAVETLVWPYSYDDTTAGNPAWAMAVMPAADGQSARELELTIADSTRPDDTAASSPVRLPAGSGLHVTSLAGAGPDGGLALAGADGGAWDLGWSAFTLRTSDKPGTSTTTINGRQWIVYSSGGSAGSLGLIADGWGMTVTPQDGQTPEQVRAFAATLQFAPDLADRASWFDAENALP